MVHAVWAKNTIFSLSAVGRCQGQAVVAVWHFEATALQEALFLNDGIRQAASSDLGEDWRANMLATWRQCHTTDYFLDRVRTQVVEIPTRFEAKLVAVDNVQGLPVGGDPAVVIGPADDLATSGVIRWRSLLAGKRHRGRTYVGPLSDSGAQAGVLQAAFIAQVQAFSDAMITRYTGVGVGQGVNFKLTTYSRPYNQFKYQYTRRVGGLLTVISPPDYNGDSTNVSVATVDNIARTQRRREIGVGS